MNQLKKYFDDKDKEAKRAEIEQELNTLSKLKQAEQIRVHIIKIDSRYDMCLENLYNNFISIYIPLRKVFSRKDASTLRKKIYFSYITVEKGTPIYNYLIGKVENYLNLQKSKF